MQAPALGHTQFCYQRLIYHIYMKISKTHSSSRLFCILDKSDCRHHPTPAIFTFWNMLQCKLNFVQVGSE